MKNKPKFGRRYETSKLPQDGEARRKEMGVRVGEVRRALDQIQCQWTIQVEESGRWLDLRVWSSAE